MYLLPAKGLVSRSGIALVFWLVFLLRCWPVVQVSASNNRGPIDAVLFLPKLIAFWGRSYGCIRRAGIPIIESDSVRIFD